MLEAITTYIFKKLEKYKWGTYLIVALISAGITFFILNSKISQLEKDNKSLQIDHYSYEKTAAICEMYRDASVIKDLWINNNESVNGESGQFLISATIDHDSANLTINSGTQKKEFPSIKTGERQTFKYNNDLMLLDVLQIIPNNSVRISLSREVKE